MTSGAFFQRERRAQKLIAGRAGYWHDAAFDDPARQPEILADLPTDPSRLLTREQERHLFRRMNYMKYRADRLIEQIHPKRVSNLVLAEAEYWNAEAERLRNRLVCHNLRLASAGARRVARVTGKRCADLLGDAHLSLLIAVDKFDFRRGLKFSSYACTVIFRRFKQIHDKDRKAGVPTLTGYDDELFDMEDRRECEFKRMERREHARKNLNDLLRFLDRRKKRIVTEVNGLGGICYDMKTVGKRLGITAERVRQLHVQSMQILQTKASELSCDA